MLCRFRKNLACAITMSVLEEEEDFIPEYAVMPCALLQEETYLYVCHNRSGVGGRQVQNGWRGRRKEIGEDRELNGGMTYAVGEECTWNI